MADKKQSVLGMPLVTLSPPWKAVQMSGFRTAKQLASHHHNSIDQTICNGLVNNVDVLAIVADALLDFSSAQGFYENSLNNVLTDFTGPSWSTS